jgi:hypothetical protein
VESQHTNIPRNKVYVLFLSIPALTTVALKQTAYVIFVPVLLARRPSRIVPLEYNCGVVSAESKIVAKNSFRDCVELKLLTVLNASFEDTARKYLLIWGTIQVTLWVRGFIIDRRRNEAFFEHLCADRRLDAPSSPK